MSNQDEIQKNKATKFKGVLLTEEEFNELNHRAKKMHLSTSKLMVLGGLYWDGKITARENEND